MEQWVSSLSPEVNGSGVKSFVFKFGANKEGADPQSLLKSWVQTNNILEEQKTVYNGFQTQQITEEIWLNGTSEILTAGADC
jgi:hypothetical protein